MALTLFLVAEDVTSDRVVFKFHIRVVKTMFLNSNNVNFINSAFTPNSSRRPLGVRVLALKVLKIVWFLN